MMRAFLTAAMLGGAVAASLCPAQSVTLMSDRDNTLYQDASGQISNGAGEFIFTGYTLRGAGERRALIRFPVADVVPAGATISSVTLTLNCSRNVSDAGTIDLRRVLSSWGEGSSDALEPGGQGTAAAPNDATWIHTKFPTSFWSNPGGDFAAAASGQALIDGTGPVTWASTAGMVADVQLWLDNPGSNHGWMLLSPQTGSANARRLDSRENRIASLRPRLTVNYTLNCSATLVPAPSPCGTRTAQLSVVVLPSATAFRWQALSSGGDWSDLVDGPLAIGSAKCAVMGSNTASLTITPPYDAGAMSVRAIVITPCGERTTDPLVVQLCPADFNCSGNVGVQDIFDFLEAYFGGDASADVTASNGLSVQDIFDFLADYFAGGC